MFTETRLFRSNSDRVNQVVEIDTGGSLKRSGSERWRAKAALFRQRREREQQTAQAEPAEGEPKDKSTANRIKQFFRTTIRRKKKDSASDSPVAEILAAKSVKAEFFKSKKVNGGRARVRCWRIREGWGGRRCV
jgi:hypothetical protein